MSHDRTNDRQPLELRVGSWRVLPAANELRDGDRVVRVRPKVMDLLEALARRPGEVCTKSELLDEVWPEVVVGDASLSVAVAELRDALGDDPTRPQFIETIPRRGYRLMAPIMSTVDPPTAADSTPSYRLVGEDATYVLGPGRTTVGRDARCEIRFESRLVSRVHAAFEVMDGRVVVEDLGSRNGTFVEGRPIDRPTELQPGDRVRLGRHAATLQLTSESASTWTELSAVEGLER